MGKRLGIYAVDRSESMAEQGYSDSSLVWKRTALARDGQVMAKTGQEFDRLGVLVRDGDIIVNGAAYGSGDVDRLGRMQGAALQCDGEHCINITLEDYNLLRSGQEVKGYNRYDENAVYNIVDNVATASLVDKPDTDGMDDVTLNSLIAINDEDRPVGGTHNTLTEATMFCAAEHGVNTEYYETTSPECVMRHFDPIISEGDGLELEYFVDTKYYDSVTKGRLGDTFTVIVEAANGQVLFKATTYAGQFKVTTKPFKTDADGVGDNLKGHTWFSIRCIDNHHVGSIERFFKVLIRPANYTPNIYQMTAQDLTTWRITPDTDSLETGHYNRVGLSALFASKKAAHYDGVKLYNANPDADDEDTAFGDVANTRYYIDFHQNVGSGNNFVAAGFKRFFLIHYADGVIKGIDKAMKDITLADFDSMELLSGEMITVDGKSVSVPAGTSPYEFIKADGAEIFRYEDGENAGKVMVAYDNDLLPTEAALDKTGEVVKGEYSGVNEQRHYRALRIRSLNVILKNAKEENLWRSFMEYPSREGWFYASWFDGTWSHNSNIGIHANGMGGIVVPDGFTVDLNKTTLLKTDSTDITGDFYLFNLSCTSDVHIKNGKLVGCFGRQDLKDAFLKTCKNTTGGTWEGGGNIRYIASEFCSVEDVEVTGSEGYEFLQGPTYYAGDYYKQFNGIAETRNSNREVHFDDSNAYHSGDFSAHGAAGYINTIGRDGEQSPVMCSIPVGSHDYNVANCTHITMATSDNISLVGEIRRDGETGFEEYVWPYVWVGAGTTRHMYGGKYPEIFVHFYDADGSWMRTVKTHHWTGIIVPDGARTFRVTTYGLCHIVDGKAIVGCHINGSGNRVTTFKDRLDRFKAWPYLTTEGCLVQGCYIHDTRSIAHGNHCLNGAIIGCEYDRVAVAPGRFGLTRLFMDWEENSCTGGLLAFWDCNVHVDRNLPIDEGGKSQIVTHDVARELDIRRCRGLGFGLGINRSYIADSLMYDYVDSRRGGFASNYQIIIKRNRLLNGEFTCSEDGSSRYTLSDTNFGGSTCDEPVNTEFVVNDCFVGNAGKTVFGALKGRTINVMGAKHDSINTLDKTQRQVEVIMKDWEYVEIVTTQTNESVLLHYGAALETIIDGVTSNVTAPGGYARWTFATPGRHTVYYRGANGAVIVKPYTITQGCGVTRYTAATTVVKVDNPTGIRELVCLGAPFAIYSPSNTRFRSTEYYKMLGMFPELRRIIVPADQLANYLAHEQWSMFADRITPGEFTYIES